MLTVLYSFYLNVSRGDANASDFITTQVAKQSSWLIGLLGYDAFVEPLSKVPAMKLHINESYLARIVEGCNSVSILILFSAFIVSFAQRWKKTLLFILGGVLFLYLINIARIALFTIALYEYPQHKEILHDVIFPGIIYGSVFLLWMYWVRNIGTPKEVNELSHQEFE